MSGKRISSHVQKTLENLWPNEEDLNKSPWIKYQINAKLVKIPEKNIMLSAFTGQSLHIDQSIKFFSQHKERIMGKSKLALLSTIVLGASYIMMTK